MKIAEMNTASGLVKLATITGSSLLQLLPLLGCTDSVHKFFSFFLLLLCSHLHTQNQTCVGVEAEDYWWGYLDRPTRFICSQTQPNMWTQIQSPNSKRIFKRERDVKCIFNHKMKNIIILDFSSLWMNETLPSLIMILQRPYKEACW